MERNPHTFTPAAIQKKEPRYAANMYGSPRQVLAEMSGKPLLLPPRTFLAMTKEKRAKNIKTNKEKENGINR